MHRFVGLKILREGLFQADGVYPEYQQMNPGETLKILPMTISADRRDSRLMGRCILIIEPDISGHHSRTLGWILTAVAAKFSRLILVTRAEYLSSSTFVDRSFSCEVVGVSFESLLCNPGPSRFGGFISRQIEYRQLRKRIEEEFKSFAVTDIFFPFYDRYAYAASIQGLPRLTRAITWGLLFRPWKERSSVRVSGKITFAVKKFLLSRLLSSPRQAKLLCVGETVPDTSFLPSSVRPKVVQISDAMDLIPSEDVSKSKLSFCIDKTKTVILMYGAIAERKGLTELIALAINDQRLVLLIVGKWDADCTSKLASPEIRLLLQANRCVILDKFVDQTTESAAFAAADIVWVGYKGFYGSSGVLVQAGLASRPVIGCKVGAIGRTIALAECGVSIDVDGRVDVMLEETRSLIGDKTLREALGRNGFNYFSRRNTPESFVNQLMMALDQSPGLSDETQHLEQAEIRRVSK